LGVDFTAKMVQRGPEMTVVLYQQGECGSPVNVNEVILSDVVDSLPPITRHVGHISHVTISYISSHGDVYVVSDSPQPKRRSFNPKPLRIPENGDEDGNWIVKAGRQNRIDGN